MTIWDAAWSDDEDDKLASTTIDVEDSSSKRKYETEVLDWRFNS